MATSNTKLEDIILRAVDIVASQKIAKAEYDKTIQATIVSCIDATIGKYKVKYQDSYWIAYSNNIDNFYAPNTSVYVLIPGGNMSKDKTILGTTKRLGVNYITIAQGDERYAPIGTNVINTDTTWNLCSYKTETKILYSSDFTDSQNLLVIDDDAIKEYMNSSTSIIAGAYIKNTLNTQQRFQGNYGILFGLDFVDRATGKIITRYYSIDIDNMRGNPYYYPNETRQYNVFEIDGEKFEKVNMIALFTKDFPVQKDNMPDDIFISKIELGGAISLQQEDLDSYAMVLLTPKGYIFSQDSAEADTRTFEAQLRVKGKIVDIESQNVDFYWFVENLSITAGNPKYNKYGGQGWECLNDYQIIKDEEINGSDTSPAIFQFVPESNIFSIKKSDVLAETTKYKCVAVYDNTVLKREFKVIRYDSSYDIQITSTNGTQFYNNVGITTLTCNCYQKHSDGSSSIVDVDDLKFVWATINNAGNFNSLPTTIQYNDDKIKLIAVKEAIEEYIEAEYLLNQEIYDVQSLLPADIDIVNVSNVTKRTKMAEAKEKLVNVGLTTENNIINLLEKYNVETEDLTYRLVLDGDESHENSLKTAINSYNSIQQVLDNQIEGVQINNITDFIVFKCSVFTKIGNIFLGSGSITLTNLQDGNRYSLVINNGTQVFKYNTHGVSPASKQNQQPQTIPALTFTIYDNTGEEVNSDVINNVDTIWTLANNNTLLRTNYSGGIVDSTLEKISYKNLTSFVYSIAENYNANHTRNDIELKVQYNGLTLFAKTNLSFLKQGENGTNGTNFVCKIVPNVLSGDVPVNPTIYYDDNGIVSFNWNTDTVNNRWFKAQLWHNGNQPIFESIETGNSTEGKLVTVVKWEVLKNIYSYNTTDTSNLNAVAAQSTGNWSFSFTPRQIFELDSQEEIYRIDQESGKYFPEMFANVIKVTLSYDGMTYYATLPIITCKIFNNNYSVKLKDYSGFRQVLYDSSGQSPKYDSHAPFEILTSYKIEDRWQDISTKTTEEYHLGYDWYYLGSVKYKNNNVWEQDKETTDENGESSKKWLLKSNIIQVNQSNQKAIKPADSYNGECVNTALACRVYLMNNNTNIAYIHIPIHMMRNRFENSALNGWDGNSVNLGGENGGMILAPQVGAGVKDNQNKFTGIFIGTAKDPQQNLSEEKNNTSNSTQGRFASTNEDVGLFGYNAGSRSIFLDAKTGKAVFGQQGQAQIILDPSQTNNGRKVAQIKSGNYNTVNGTGLLIDLSTPEIKFGSGNFEVDSSGHIIAKGGGQIAGWKINDYALFNKETNTGLVDEHGEEIKINEKTTGMNSYPKTDESSAAEQRSVRIPPLSDQDNEGEYKTESKAAAFWAGGSKFFVTHDGYLRAQQASIGSGTKPIFIGGTQLISGKSESAIFSGLKSSITANNTGFYLGTDGIALGSVNNITLSDGTPKTASNFQVDTDGTLYARKGYIGNGRNGWQIGSNYLKNNRTNINDLSNKKGVFIGTDGFSLGTIELEQEPTTEILYEDEEDMIYNDVIETVNTAESGMYKKENGKIFSPAFKVTNDGILISKIAKIGNFYIRESSISTDGKNNYSNTQHPNRTYFGIDGLRIGGNNFSVDNFGCLKANQITIGDGVDDSHASIVVNGRSAFYGDCSFSSDFSNSKCTLQINGDLKINSVAGVTQGSTIRTPGLIVDSLPTVYNHKLSFRRASLKDPDSDNRYIFYVLGYF